MRRSEALYAKVYQSDTWKNEIARSPTKCWIATHPSDTPDAHPKSGPSARQAIHQKGGRRCVTVAPYFDSMRTLTHSGLWTADSSAAPAPSFTWGSIAANERRPEDFGYIVTRTTPYHCARLGDLIQI